MAKSLSEDLRERFIAAVETGMSRRAAAKRFGVAAASAVRWAREWRTSGTKRAKPQGGDRRSHRIEAYGEVLLAAIEAKVDITLVELAEIGTAPGWHRCPYLAARQFDQPLELGCRSSADPV